MRIKKGDQVKMMVGKDRGKTAKVIAVFPDEGRLTVEGLNMVKKRSRPRKQGEKGQTVSVPRPMNASKVMLVCPNCGKPTRIGMRVEEKEKFRYCKQCEARM